MPQRIRSRRVICPRDRALTISARLSRARWASRCRIRDALGEMYALPPEPCLPQAGRTIIKSLPSGPRPRSTCAASRRAKAKSARNAQASSGTNEGSWGLMTRVLGQMRASTDPLSGAKGLKEELTLV
jgi:hypothetical protein